MQAIEAPQSRLSLPHTLSAHFMSPDRAQSQSQASMMSEISEILDAYSEPRQPSPPLPHNNEPSRNIVNSMQQRPTLQPSVLDRPNDSPGFSDHSAASASTTPPPQSPMTPDSSPPKASTILADDRLLESPSQSVRSWKKTRITQPGVVAAEQHRSDLDKEGDCTDSTRYAKPQHLRLATTDPHKAHSLKHKPEVNGLRRLSGEHEMNGLNTAEWDSSHMRNVTVRKTRKQHQKSHSGSNTGDENRRLSSGRYDPETPSHLKHEIAESQLRELHQCADGTTSSPIHKAPQSPETEMRRWSGSSRSSAVVKATVIFPEQRVPKLRHVSKNESLRSGASAQSNRNSWGSDAPLSPVVTQIEKRKRLSTDTNGSSQSPPQILRRRADFEPRQLIVHDEPGDLHQREIQPSASPETITDARSANTGFQAMHPKRLRTFEVPLGSPGSLRSNLTGSPDVFHDAASHVTHHPSFESLRTQSRAPIDCIDEMHGTPRPSADFPSASPDTLRRVSFDPALSRSELFDRHSRFSPMSVRSEATEAFEVGEANTLDIYPHTHAIHGSVLKVDVPLSKPSSMERQAQIERCSGLKVIDGPFTPAHQRSDSPWKYPREAPQPPMDSSPPPLVAIHPPTPARESDAQDEAAVTSSRPTRHTSLLQRARRYSDTVLQPISGSLRRRTRNGQQERSGSSQHVDESEEHTNLHPFWKPRHHWNDLSDSENEAANEAAINHWNGRVPIESRESRPATADGFTWRRGGSLRGFLLGNTLGIERGPTNKRRPRITLPSQRATQSAPPSSYKTVSVRDSARQSRTSERTATRRDHDADENKRHRRDSSLTRFWNRLQGHQKRKDEMAAEARREELRHNIKMLPNTDDDSS